ncbi:MAG: hypothetical protein WD934_10405 [Gemmatimonadales bacterium]
MRYLPPMRIQPVVTLWLAFAAAPVATAQSSVVGTWRAETPDGTREIIVRADSSASFGDETVRWRVVADSIFIALGDEWLVYNFRVRGRQLTLSGGDLEEPITLTRTGPATPRPENVPVPPAPPMDRRAVGL